MKVVKKVGIDVYRFKCNCCGQHLEAYNNEFRFVRFGLLEYDCPICRQPRRIEERLVTRIEKETIEDCA